MRPLQHVQVAPFRRVRARPPVSRASVGARPLQHVQVAAVCREHACAFVPRASVGARPLQHAQVTAFRRARARAFVPRASVGARPSALASTLSATNCSSSLPSTIIGSRWAMAASLQRWCTPRNTNCFRRTLTIYGMLLFFGAHSQSTDSFVRLFQHMLPGRASKHPDEDGEHTFFHMQV